jgi:hypothetical protein
MQGRKTRKPLANYQLTITTIHRSLKKAKKKESQFGDSPNHQGASTQ